jgi:hypothetical protein
VDIEILCTDRTCKRLVRHHITHEGVTVSEIRPQAQTGQPEQRPQIHNH